VIVAEPSRQNATKEGLIVLPVRKREQIVVTATLLQNSGFYSGRYLKIANRTRQDKVSVDILDALTRIEQSHKVSVDILDALTRLEQSQTVMQNQIEQVQKVQEVMVRHLPDAASEIKKEASVVDSPSDEYRRKHSSESQALPSIESTPGQRRLSDLPQRDAFQQDPFQQDPFQQDPFQQDPFQQDPFQQDPLQQDPLQQDPLLRDRQGQQEEEEEESGDPGTPKPPSIPVNHTTGAARLLLEPPIAEMCKGIVNKSKLIRNEKYPLNAELKRGLLRLYGRGEGLDAVAGYEKEFLVDHGSESTPGDTNSDVSSPADDQCHGQLGGMTPPASLGSDFSVGDIDSNGMPNFSRDRVLPLVQSYKDNINNMHPLLVPHNLDTLVENFLKSIPENPVKSKGPIAGFVRNAESPGNKRKRSPGLMDYPNTPESRDWDLLKPGRPQRSISSAIVLCVLALGSICLRKGKIPDCVPDREDGIYGSSPTVRNGQPPSPMSSPSMSTPMGIPSPLDTDREQLHSRRTSIEGGPYPTKGHATKARNLDRIPGLIYFALATDIIGNQLGGNSLPHVHCNILAGLYHGQLARVMESHAYIHEACRGLQVLLRP
jgi:hypothetical protein